MAGRSEQYFRGAVRWLKTVEVWVHKNADGVNGEHGPDYFIALGGLQVECKNTDREGALTDGPSPLQRSLLDKYSGYIWLMLWDKGYPPLPKGADAYLVPWFEYRNWWDALPQATAEQPRAHKVRRHPKPGMPDIPTQWRVLYQCVYGKGGFVIPWTNIYWEEVSIVVNEMYNQFGSIEKIKRTFELGGTT